MSEEFFPWIILSSSLLFLLVVCFIIKYVNEATTTTTTLNNTGDGVVLKENKKQAPATDPNKWGRWSCTLATGKTVTKVGKLSTILNIHDIISYHEIK